jgi:hypothetical protein
MGTDLLLLVSLTLISFAAKSYSSTVSLVFENLFIKFFRSLRPSYLASYLRSIIISWLSLRNQSISFVSLSFLNSGIIPNFQALGLVMGSYFGLSLSLLYLNLYQTPLKFILVAVALVSGVFSNTNKVAQISKMFFFAAMILFGFELFMYSLNSNSTIINQLDIWLSINRLSIIAIVLILYLVFKNSFTILAILYAFYLRNLISDDQVVNAILSVLVYNSFWYMIGTKNAHRETRAISYAAVLISVMTGIVVIGAQIIFPDWFIEKSQSTLAFTLNCIILSLVMGLFGYLVSVYITEFTNKFFPAGKVKELRQIQIFTSKNHYPTTYLVEFYEQEYKKLFALINSIQSLISSQWVTSEDKNQGKIEKYSQISNRILKEMDELEIQMSQSERTVKQAQKVFKLREKLGGLKSLVHSLTSVYQIKLKILDNLHPRLEENKVFFVQPLQKIQEFCEYIFSSYIETESEDVQKVIALLGQLTEELAKSRSALLNLKDSEEIEKDEVDLIYEFVGELQLLSIAIHKLAR